MRFERKLQFGGIKRKILNLLQKNSAKLGQKNWKRVNTICQSSRSLHYQIKQIPRLRFRQLNTWHLSLFFVSFSFVFPGPLWKSILNQVNNMMFYSITAFFMRHPSLSARVLCVQETVTESRDKISRIRAHVPTNQRQGKTVEALV